MKILLLCLILINALGLLLMRVDKYKAQNKLWRIPEAALFAVAAIGGSFGTYAGMRLFHHKTRYRRFRIGLPVLMIIHIIVLFDLFRLGVLFRL